MKYTFDQVCNFKIGERYWESNQYGNVHFEVRSEPEVEVCKSGLRVQFTAVNLDTDESIMYLMTKGLEHYGPSICDYPEYMSLDELRARGMFNG